MVDLEVQQPDYLFERSLWLVRMRWVGVFGVLATVLAVHVLEIVPDAAPLLVVTAALAVFNAYAWVQSRRPPTHAANIARRIFAQLGGDLLVLSLLLHFSGGAENPFAMFVALLMALGAMLLPPPMPLYLGLIAVALHGGVVLGEFAGVFSHTSLFTVPPGPTNPSHPALLWRTPSYVAGYLTAYTLMVFGVLYFVGSVVERYREAEEQRRAHERLAMSRERLARIGEIAAGVAHSVRNPLHGLIGSIDLLKAKPTEDPVTVETLALMAEACRRIESVAQRLLVLTRSVPIRKRTIDLETVVTDAVSLTSPTSRQSRARITTRIDHQGPLLADPDALVEALINVIDNAVDACRDGGFVTVHTTAGPESGATIEVSDTGPGIPAIDLPKVCDPFFTTKPVGEGTGLGLAITRRIVEAHGGTLSIESEPGKGTQVRLLLPRVEDPRAEDP